MEIEKLTMMEKLLIIRHMIDKEELHVITHDEEARRAIIINDKVVILG